MSHTDVRCRRRKTDVFLVFPSSAYQSMVALKRSRRLLASSRSSFTFWRM